MSSTYNYGSHNDLEPTELFLFIAVDQTCKQLGIDDVEYVILILSGLPILPTRAKPLGATKGTSVASVMSRSLFRYELKKEHTNGHRFSSVARAQSSPTCHR